MTCLEFVNTICHIGKGGVNGLDKDKIIHLRADDETLEALEQVKAYESQKRLGTISSSECVRYLIKKEAVNLSADNKKT